MSKRLSIPAQAALREGRGNERRIPGHIISPVEPLAVPYIQRVEAPADPVKNLITGTATLKAYHSKKRKEGIMYAARFMSKKELRTLQSGAQIKNSPYLYRVWDRRNRQGEEGNYCFFSLNSADDVRKNIGLICRMNFKVEGKVLVIVKIKGLSRTPKYEAAYNGSFVDDYPGESGWDGCDTSVEFNTPCYSKADVKVVSISSPRNCEDACYCMFSAMKKKGVLKKETTFRRFLRDAERIQQRNYKYVERPLDWSF